MNTYEAYPWDEPAPNVIQRWRNWQGMPTRIEWNASPHRRTLPVCESCGYKWETWEMQDTRCWNCYQIETNPGYVQRFWDRVDNGGKPKPEPQKRLERL